MSATLSLFESLLHLDRYRIDFGPARVCSNPDGTPGGIFLYRPTAIQEYWGGESRRPQRVPFKMPFAGTVMEVELVPKALGVPHSAPALYSVTLGFRDDCNESAACQHVLQETFLRQIADADVLEASLHFGRPALCTWGSAGNEHKAPTVGSAAELSLQDEAPNGHQLVVAFTTARSRLQEIEVGDDIIVNCWMLRRDTIDELGILHMRYMFEEDAESPFTGPSEVSGGFFPTRDRAIPGGSLISFKEETPVAPFGWFTGRREWLRRFCALGFGEVDLIVEMRGFVLRLMCPENAVCSAAEVYYKQVAELRRIMDDDASQFETATGSSWFEIASNTMQLPPKDGSFLVQTIFARLPGYSLIRIASATKDDFNWMKTKLAVGQLLDVQVEFIWRDFQDETHTVLRRDYYLRVTEWDVAPSRWVLRKSSDYVCDLADVRGCSKCGVDHKT
ncbi:hypothetical protein B0H11DRAFT_1921962 [Mycena galericulata]|nr:hypothetical protein B0H11DRAFT_1921962 [Mycena galericulata]